MENKISIYGGSGFVGGAFVKAFSHDCIVIPREQRKPASNKILYLISTTDNYNVFGDLKKDINTNLITLMETLEQCPKGKDDFVFNFVSSWFVYGSCNLPANETTPCDPKGFYSITKRCAEQMLISFCETHGINYRILRLGNVYGKGDTKAGTKKNAIQHMVSQVLSNQPVSLYEGGDVVRDLIHVKDVARAIKLVVDQGEINAIYNIGSGIPTKIKDIISLAVNLTNSSSQILSTPTPPFHAQVQARDFWLDTTKLQGLGFKQEVMLEDGVRELLT
jgi:nucleoside-diphosphate-sugar epimerase